MSDVNNDIDEDEEDDVPEPVVRHRISASDKAKSDAFFSDSACEARWNRLKEAMDRPKEARASSDEDKTDIETDKAESTLDTPVP